MTPVDKQFLMGEDSSLVPGYETMKSFKDQQRNKNIIFESAYIQGGTLSLVQRNGS